MRKKELKIKERERAIEINRRKREMAKKRVEASITHNLIVFKN